MLTRRSQLKRTRPLKSYTPMKRSRMKPGKGFKASAQRRSARSMEIPGASPQSQMRPRGKGFRAKPDPNLAAWGRRVRTRDGNECRFPGDCQSGDNRIDPHHIAPRGRRPDLIYVDANGICLCRWHHDWAHNNPLQAERMGILNFDSYELAQKIKAGYVVPGDEDDDRVTL